MQPQSMETNVNNGAELVKESVKGPYNDSTIILVSKNKINKAHKPSKEIAVECQEPPDYKTETTKRSLEKFGEYIYNHP